MTQLEALERVKELMPAIADGIRVERMHSIGKQFGHDDQFRIWDHSGGDGPNIGRCEILATSEHSWEHAIAQLELNRVLLTTPADQSPVEDEVEQRVPAVPTFSWRSF